MKREVPILLLTGYLGSGKTTLVNHLLANQQGIRAAVIVNDIGEVNIDASLIQKGGVVDTKDDSLVPLQNGCICCTLKMDLANQVADLVDTERFDYIVIEASGICEPEPIAQTLCALPQMGEAYNRHGVCRLDNIVTVVDALRLQSEFACGEDLTRKAHGEEDIENLIVQQIEFCNTIVLNKASEVSPDELKRIEAILRALQPSARILPADYAQVDLGLLLHTRLFRFEQVAASAGWVRAIERPLTAEEEREARQPADSHHHHEEHEEHDHDHGEHDHDHEDHDHGGHHHHHHHEGGEVEEYGISTFVYYRRRPFDIHRFDHFCATRWPRNVIRAKGVCYFDHNRDMSFLFEQAGVQKSIREAGLWFATAPADELAEMMEREPELRRDWDEQVGDRMVKIVFIGQHMDREWLTSQLDACLA